MKHTESELKTNNEKILRDRAVALADRVNIEKCSKESQTAFMVVQVANTQYGVELADLNESTQITKVTPIPGAVDPHFLGLTASRGELKAVFDLAGWLGSEATDTALQCGFLLYLKKQNDTGFLVDELNDIYYFTQDQIEEGTLEESTADICFAKVSGINLIKTSRLLERISVSPTA